MNAARVMSESEFSDALLQQFERRSVQRAYAIQNGNAERVLVDDRGRIYVSDANEWTSVSAATYVARLPGVYHSWSDVPFSWCGGCPFWK